MAFLWPAGNNRRRGGRPVKPCDLARIRYARSEGDSANWPLAFARLVAAEHAQKIGDFTKMVQGILALLVLGVAGEIQMEEVLPRASAQRPRFHLGQVNIAQGENAEALE